MTSRTRREFLQRLSAAGVLSLGGLIPQSLVRAAQQAGPERTSDRVLVLVQLAGGNDGLNTVIPRDDAAYRKARPALGLPAGSLLHVGNHWSLHPSLTALHELYEEGALSVLHGVGYPQPDRSHFRSTDIWQTASLTPETSRDGWLGRLLEQAQDAGQPCEGAALGMERLPLAMSSHRIAVPVWNNLDELRVPETSILTPGSAERAALLEQPRAAQSESEFIRRTLQAGVQSAESLRDAAARTGEAAAYPDSRLARSLKGVAQLIAAELPVKVFSVVLEGFDTHAQQLAGHAALLAELSAALGSFWNDLSDRKLTDRVLVVTYSEFGRRVAENGSLGTDHGAASMMFSLGGQQSAGHFGRPSSFETLNDGDLEFTTDFRDVYATIMTRWLKLNPQPVLGQAFNAVDRWLA